VLRCPAGATQHQQRSLCLAQQAAQVATWVSLGAAWISCDTGHRHASRLFEHVFRQGDHDRTWPPAAGALKGARHNLGNAVGPLHLLDRLGHVGKHRAIVDFLKRLSPGEIGADLPDENDQGCGILARVVNSDRRVAGTGPAGDEHHAGLSGQPGVGIGHEDRAGFVAIDDQADAGRDVVQRVEHAEVALPGNAEDVIDPWISN